MIVAKQKRKENIAEYLLYMWQVEDLIRANQFDIDSIRRTVIAQYDQPDDVKEEIAGWYEELIEMMRSEGVKEKGHIQLNKNVIIALTDLHLRLLKSTKEMVYGTAYYKTLPYIVQLRAKSGERTYLNWRPVLMQSMAICFSVCREKPSVRKRRKRSNRSVLFWLSLPKSIVKI